MSERKKRAGSRKKSVFVYVIVALLFLGSLFLVCYPFLSNYLMEQNQENEVTGYEQEVENASEDDLAAALAAAQAYNESLFGSVVLTDPFDPDWQPQEDQEYEQLLNPGGDSVMATIEIPAIHVNLPVYHGTADEVLQKGAGHMRNTSLPVGGIGTHAVITGHTGLSSAKLFTDLELLETGDVFLIHVLGDTLAYQVDQIKVVEPDQTDDLRIDPEQDYVTLVTCTPYGVNSHRLLVRGTRIPYEEAEDILAQDVSRDSESTWMEEYKKALVAGIVIFVLILTVFALTGKRKNRGKKKNGEDIADKEKNDQEKAGKDKNRQR